MHIIRFIEKPKKHDLQSSFGSINSHMKFKKPRYMENISKCRVLEYHCNDDFEDANYYGEDGLPIFRPMVIIIFFKSQVYLSILIC